MTHDHWYFSGNEVNKSDIPNIRRVNLQFIGSWLINEAYTYVRGQKPGRVQDKIQVAPFPVKKLTFTKNSKSRAIKFSGGRWSKSKVVHRDEKGN